MLQFALPDACVVLQVPCASFSMQVILLMPFTMQSRPFSMQVPCIKRFDFMLVCCRGDGYEFIPFSFEELMVLKDDETD